VRVGPSGGKGKDKDKKDAPRQTTLFGMMPGRSPTNDKKARNKKRPEPKATLDPPAANNTLPDSQATDITMSDVEPSDAGTMAETQPDLPDGWEETQIVDNSQALLEGSVGQPPESLTVDSQSQETQLV
jgi:chromosome transmission fidelity protein 4